MAEQTTESWEPVELVCPQCGGQAVVAQVQGDRCPGCGFEFKRFGPGEAQTARDYFAVLTRQKHIQELTEGRGFVVAHE